MIPGGPWPGGCASTPRWSRPTFTTPPTVESLLAMWAAGGERAEDLDPFRQDKAPRSEEVGFAHDSALEGGVSCELVS